MSLQKESILEINESRLIQSFNKINILNMQIYTEIRQIIQYFINLWEKDNYHKKLKVGLQKPHEVKTYIQVSYPKAYYCFYISIGSNSIDVSTYDDRNFKDPAIYSVTLANFVNKPNKYIKEIKKLLNKKFEEVL